jgi:endonuclease III
MARSREKIDNLLEEHGETFCEELGINIARNTPSPLFRLLCFALLASARISHRIAIDATRALAEAGWRTPERLADSTWKARVRVLNRAGYARYDESTSTMLGETTARLLDEYGGDLRKLRDAAGGDIDAARRGLKAFKGIGDAGADMFLREAQVAWEEVYPFMDDRPARMARSLGLPDEAAKLARQVGDRHEFVRVVDALVRKSFSR